MPRELNTNEQLRSTNVNTLQSTPSTIRHSLTRFALLGASALTLLGCAAPAQLTASVAANPPLALPVRTIGATLRANPRFSDYVDVLDFAGLGRALNDAQGVTVFAPTNAAFERSDPSWRVHAVPGTGASSNSGTDVQKRQAVLEQSGLQGVHPVADFAGKLQDVRAINGRIFHIDGRVPGAITITTGDIATTMGATKPVLRIANVQLPPISAKGGLIYPVDTILVSAF